MMFAVLPRSIWVLLAAVILGVSPLAAQVRVQVETKEAAPEEDIVRPATEPAPPRASTQRPSQPDSTNAKKPQVDPESLESILKRARDVQSERARLDNQPAPKPPEKPDLTIVLENPFLSQGRYRSNNEYDRAFAVRLLIANPTDKDVELKRAGVSLTLDQKTYKAETNTNNYSTSFSVGNKHFSTSSLSMPDVVKIPAGKSASAWATFGKLPMNPAVPDMKLTLDLGEEKREIDVNRFCRGLLKTSVKRLGPKDCLAILSIAGDLNAVNARSLVEELDDLAIKQKVARVIIRWEKDAAPVESNLMNWLQQAAVQAGQPRPNNQNNNQNILSHRADGHSRIASHRVAPGERPEFVERSPIADSQGHRRGDHRGFENRLFGAARG